MSTTTKAAHTTGPWATEEEVYGIDVVVKRRDKDSLAIAEVPGISGREDDYEINDEDRANARLIAAAPEMLEALEYFCKFYESKSHEDAVKNNDPPSRDCPHCRAEAAIQKARGISS